MKKNKTLKKCLITTIATATISLTALFSASNVSLAYGTWQGNENSGMPSLSVSPSGLFPQILKQRMFTGDADNQFPYQAWTTEMSTGTVYCNDAGKAVRFGEYDYKRYYMDEVGYTTSNGYGYIDFENRMKYVLKMAARAKALANGGVMGEATATVSNISYTQFRGPTDDPTRWAIEKDKPMLASAIISDGGYSKSYAIAKQRAEKIIWKIFDKLGKWKTPEDTEDKTTNPEISQSGWNGDAIYGPEVVIMETKDRAQDHYQKVGSTEKETNTQLAFVLTTMENAYSGATGSIHNRYSLSDIQTAHWKVADLDGNIPDGRHLTAKGLTLYSKALSYQNFLDNYINGNGYKAQIHGVANNSYASGAKSEKQDTQNANTVNDPLAEAQVIVNQATKSYIVGPLSVTYPYYEDISYMKAIYLVTDKGTENEKTLVYDENTDDFEIEFIGETKSGSNGLKKKYPASGAKFYVKFSAEKTNYPKTVNMYVDLEYLEKTTATFNILDTKANVYQYIGYVARGGKYQMREAFGTGRIDFTYYTRGPFNIPIPHRDSITIDSFSSVLGVVLVQPFVQMSVKPVRYLRAQQLRVSLDGSRTYNVYTATVSGKPDSEKPDTPDTPDNDIDIPINLTFELGGRVWVDNRAGKENKYDGLFNKEVDTPMSNVKVSLYQVSGLDGNQSGKFIAATTTDDNGEYLFQNQNAMYQYYVKFTYNGQYYQPTVYNVNRQDSNWDNTSKGLDILTERDTFNASFREIGSAPKNTVTTNKPSEMHTREELEKSGKIDKFGNINGQVDDQGERKSDDEYVNQSMMNAYTCNGTTKKDLYPGFQVFVTEDFLNAKSNTAQILKFVAAQKIETLYKNPDVMHHINLGLVLREQLDLALRKDVYKATLEINGKTQVYKYNKRENLETDAAGNSYWEIKTRISDGYYSYDYSRELYREDYDYKVNNYQIVDNATTLDNLGLSEDSELKVYVTYKFTIRNRSENIAAAVTEVVDYYDADYTYVQDRSYLGDNAGNKIGNVYLKDASRYGVETQTTIAGYKNLYITGDQSYSNAANDTVTSNMFPLSDPDSNKDVYFYVTFMVNKDAARNILLDEDAASGTAKGVGKENIAEINGYKSYYGQKAKAPNTGNSQTQQEYKTGDIAGIADCNSTPGNLNPTDVPKDGVIKYENFENDTDKAPNIRIILNRDNLRTVEGTVFEDTRNVDEQNARVGDGLKDNETGINGVRVQLIELRQGKDGKTYEYIWKEVLSGNTDSTTPIINNSGLVPNYTIDTANADGKYKFTSFAPGNYIVRFIYGSGESTVLGTTYTNYNNGNEEENPVTNLYASQEGYNKKTAGSGYSASAVNIGLNKNSYNGQDYKSTSYQVGVNNGSGAYTNNTTGSYQYNFSAADQGQYSDAKDIMNKNDNVVNIAPNADYLVNCNNARKNVEAYSNGDMTNHLAEILASYESIPEYNGTQYTAEEMKNLLNEFMNNTYMVAESGTIDVNFEYNRTGNEDNVTNTSGTGHNNIGGNNYEMAGHYVLENLDLGLVQRPKAQLKVTKQITNVKLTLANNSTLFDASARATNVLWVDHKAHGQDTDNVYSTDKNYNNSLMLNPVVRQNSTNKGKVQLTMDEELMHGSTLQITYAITVANVGEVDYNEEQFYYTGKVADTSTIVKTDPRVLVDYVGTQVHDYNSNDDNTSTRNNLQFNKAQNPDWNTISSADLLNNGLLNTRLTDNVNKYTDGHIITTTAASKGLIPVIADQSNVKDKIANAFKSDPLHALETVNSTQSVSGVQLILTQMITQDSSSDDRIYNNMTELVTTQNTVGRKMSYSVVGNQDPTMEPREIDADDSQEVVILPPFGNTHLFYVLGGAIALILIAGITITLVVLKKRK
ncbi:unknown [Clostridium sp. CAG:245]|nr:unknown [Clostridium sp. CAG:245]